MKKVFIAVVAAGAVLAWARSGCSQDLTWSVVLKGVRAEYSDVRHISTDSLASALADESRPAPVLIDARTREEYDVSHIAGAVHVDPDDPALDALGLDPNVPIVAYCSVGYRSSEIARTLQDQGFTNVSNLEGSLFKWANEGRAVVDSTGAPTETVHPYNALWGRLLDKSVARPR